MRVGFNTQISFQVFLPSSLIFLGFQIEIILLMVALFFFYGIYLKPILHGRSFSSLAIEIQTLPPKSVLSKFAFMVEFLELAQSA